MIRKSSDTDIRSRETVVSDLVHEVGKQLHMVVEFGNESSLIEFTGIAPSLFILLSECKEWHIQKIKELFENSELGTPYIVTERELEKMVQLYPLELIHIRSDYSLNYGEDRIAALDIAREDVREQLIREISSHILQLRSVMVSSNIDTNSIGIGALSRLVVVCKGLLSLRNVSIPVTLGTLVSEMESCYNLPRFPLSEIVASLEQDPKAELGQFFEPLHDILVHLRTTLSEGRVL